MAAKTRAERLEALRQMAETDVLIIGGGINGVGLFRELALQGVRAVLVEKTDFCAGTSAASGRVIHGGLRYLENGEFRLVREALLERNRLLHTAPHYVKPLPILIPVFTWFDGVLYSIRQFLRMQDKAGNRGVLMIKAGLMMYDLFAGKQPMPRHHFESRRESLKKRPELNPDIACTAIYYDARLTYAERLGFELVLDAEAANPDVLALNYMSIADSTGNTVTLRDETGGAAIAIKPKIVLNATGAWIDFTNKALNRPTEYIGGTKGSHVVLDYPELRAMTGDLMVHFVNRDGRILIIYPFFDRVIVGTTDIRIDHPDEAICSEAEVDYMLDAVRLVFPNMKPKREQIVFRFSGVRPLPKQNTLTTGQISRDHSAPMIPPNEQVHFPIYSLVGGKWTTFRAFSEQVADKVLAALAHPRRVHTQEQAIGGGRNFPTTADARQQWQAKYPQFTAERLDALLERYGTYAEQVITDLMAGDDTPLTHHRGYTRREIAFIAGREQVVRLDDLIMRRTLIGLLGELNASLLAELAAIVAQTQGWTDAETAEQLQHVKTLFAEKHGTHL